MLSLRIVQIAAMLTGMFMFPASVEATDINLCSNVNFDRCTFHFNVPLNTCMNGPFLGFGNDDVSSYVLPQLTPLSINSSPYRYQQQNSNGLCIYFRDGCSGVVLWQSRDASVANVGSGNDQLTSIFCTNGGSFAEGLAVRKLISSRTFELIKHFIVGCAPRRRSPRGQFHCWNSSVAPP